MEMDTGKLPVWFKIAIRGDVIERSLRVALVVGTILVLLNYTDRFLQHALCGFDFVKMVLTYLVPYGVSTYTAVGAILKER